MKQHYRKGAPGRFVCRIAPFNKYLMGIFLNGAYCQVEVDLFGDLLSLQFNTIHGKRCHVRKGLALTKISHFLQKVDVRRMVSVR